jgi:ADP-ribose pyrophosphatase
MRQTRKERFQMDLTEKQLTSEKIFDGRVLHVRLDTVRLPNGGEATREVVDHPGGVCVLAMDDQGRVLMVSQYRYPYERVLREIPAGKLEYGEDPFEAAKRELREETGATAGEFTSLGELYPSPGYCGEVLHMYMAWDLTFGETCPDEDEFLTVERVPLKDLVDQVLKGELRDAKTVAAVLKAKLLLDL